MTSQKRTRRALAAAATVIVVQILFMTFISSHIHDSNVNFWLNTITTAVITFIVVVFVDKRSKNKEE
ncbi:hypothetical protein [Eupransor demetentiae]|uniref:Uncharacterized protein n=1 Tax=Eupransor demetentiae TaxID=3109584 RepID=A0ABP0EQE2_9LACO|nr:hypothetical protein R54876_GBNLAHCA_01068 [Lactobacillaceae bacterium LMG 33000]